MKILFLLGASSRIRNFDHTIMALAARGHVVRVAGRLRKGNFRLPPALEHERISARVNPTERVDAWRDVVDLLRGARDYVRYFDPRFAQATRLVRRAYEIAPTEFVLFCERHPWVKQRWKLVAALLAFCEQLIPTDPGFEAFLREEQPDLVLVTPLVTFESYQTDYVKAAHRLGLPVTFIPFSWDNLTNKGLMRIHPDRVLVWNEVQRQEAVDLHGCAPDTVIVSGAARFDDFFARTPASARDEFLARFGLDPLRPVVLYLGSSQLTGPNEMELVRRWVESLRAADDPIVRSCGILIRAHPALSESWSSLDFSGFGQVALSLHASRDADQELFDSLHHAHVAVGLNTSAMLEAAIVGRPVHTLVIPGFDEGQTGTMHFHYLVHAFGGLATIATGFPEHLQQLASLLRGAPVVSARSRAFAERFLRPHGIEQAVSPTLASDIERSASVVRQAQPSAPAWHRPLQWALRTALGRRTSQQRAVEDSTIVGTSMSLRPVKTALEELQRGTAPVFVGPWVDTIGNELLCWIPFVRWAAATYGLTPERLIVIARGGVSEWYGSLARRHVDAATLFSAAEFEHWTDRTVPQSEQNPKQAVMSPFDQEIVERTARAFDVSDYQVLHPRLLFHVMLRLRQDRAMNELATVLQPRPLDAAARRTIDRLPRSFVAISLAFTDALPDTEENRLFLAELLAHVTTQHDVVIVDDPLPSHVDLASAPRAHSLASVATETLPLRFQTMVLAQAQAFIGSYGHLALIAAFCGTPGTAYHSVRLPAEQVDRLQSTSASGGWAELSIKRARRSKGVRIPMKVHA